MPALKVLLSNYDERRLKSGSVSGRDEIVMYECSELGCVNKVAHLGQSCTQCDLLLTIRECGDDSDYEYDESDAESTCFKCGKREAILNGLCAMCGELNPQYM